DVFFEQQEDPRQRDRIVISINMDHDLSAIDAEAITAAVTSGGVVSRMKLGSAVDIRIAKARALLPAQKSDMARSDHGREEPNSLI
ncbi:MAG: hypothetical protein K2Y16_08550, partial [Burkholderiales bacterium]|nr:hypothetical protein [Burkholderiales bacterium]